MLLRCFRLVDPSKLPHGEAKILAPGRFQVQSFPSHLEFGYRECDPILDLDRVSVIGLADFVSARPILQWQVEVLFAKETLRSHTNTADIEVAEHLPLVHRVQFVGLARAAIELLAQAAFETELAMGALIEPIYIERPEELEPPNGAGLKLGMLDLDSDVAVWH